MIAKDYFTDYTQRKRKNSHLWYSLLTLFYSDFNSYQNESMIIIVSK